MGDAVAEADDLAVEAQGMEANVDVRARRHRGVVEVADGLDAERVGDAHFDETRRALAEQDAEHAGGARAATQLFEADRAHGLELVALLAVVLAARLAALRAVGVVPAVEFGPVEGVADEAGAEFSEDVDAI